MATVEHVLSGEGAPTEAPPSVGAHYVNTADGRHYIATGTASSQDWREQLRTLRTNSDPWNAGSPFGPAICFGVSGEVWISRIPYLNPNGGEYWEWVQLTLS